MPHDGPPIKFVALWGLFALAAFFTQSQMAANGVKVAMPFQITSPGHPTVIAALD